MRLLQRHKIVVDCSFGFGSANEIIANNSANTAVTFIYLPTPSKEEEAAGAYLTMLDLISKDLPPTMFVHGVSTVTSTTL